jgi:membrane-associated phospholipid phosphatase
METIKAIQNMLGSGLEPFFLTITNLGGDLAYIVVLVIYALIILPGGARSLGTWFSISLLLNALLKDLFAEPRPYSLDNSLASPAAQKTAGGYSFPSGHAQVTATLWGLMAWQLSKQGKAWFWVFAVLLTVLVAFSRVYLGVHYLGDVLGGLAIGAVLVVLAGLASRVNLAGMNLAGVNLAGALKQEPILWALAALLALVSFFVPEESGRALGLLGAFLLSSFAFMAPKTWPSRVGVAALGLILGVGLYLGSSVLLPEGFKRSGLGAFVRYFFLAYAITQGLPAVLLRLKWLEPNEVSPPKPEDTDAPSSES